MCLTQVIALATARWGGPPGLRGAPSSRCRKRRQGLRAGEGVRPTKCCWTVPLNQAHIQLADLQADAKAAADAQDALGGLKNTAALDGMAADFAAAQKVFADMRANVVTRDTTGGFAAAIAAADKQIGRAHV